MAIRFDSANQFNNFFNTSLGRKSGNNVAYDMECYDGYAIGKLVDDVDAPATIRMEYPTLDEVLSDKGGIADDILFYRGLWDKTADDIHYGDIMMYLGEIVEE